MSRSTAVVLADHFHVDVRCRPTYREVFAIARAFCDGDFVGERRTVSRAMSYGMIRDRFGDLPATVLTTRGVDYASLRDYLIDEYGADERHARRAALALTAPLRNLA